MLLGTCLSAVKLRLTHVCKGDISAKQIVKNSRGHGALQVGC
jgi:hypothetical protein